MRVSEQDHATEQDRTEAALRQANRALRLHSLISSAVVHATEEHALLTEICRIAVQVAGYRMAWIGRAEDEPEHRVRPLTYAGPGKEFLDEVIVGWGDDEFGRGTAGRAIRSRCPAIGRDLRNNPDFAAWWHAFSKRDFASAIAVPLVVSERVWGVLVVYAAEADAFDSTEVSLLEELGANISHGMAALRFQSERAEAMTALERAHSELEARVAERTRELTDRNLELTASREKYRELVENANSIILRMDTGLRVTFFNEFAQRFFGYGERELIGRSVLGTIVPDMESTGRDLRQMIGDIPLHPERYSKNSNENIRKDGQRVWISWTNRPIFDRSGHLCEILCVGNDISELKRTERELMKAKEAAEAADRTKSAFLATMSHELRTPLNSIIGFSGILLRGLAGPLNDEQQKQLGMLQNSARHLLALINDVLDISKIEAGQLEIRTESFDLPAALNRVVNTIRPMADRKGLQVIVHVDDGVSSVRADQRRVEQVLMNLLSNAVKFTERGVVEVSCAVRAGSVQISVRDSGIGIAAEDMADLFRPFHQLDTGLARRHEGTGLGLSICKRLMDAMGGTIAAESRPGAGSTFTVMLPQQGDA